MQGSKISLSPAELALFCDAEIILTKNSILQKTASLLSLVQHDITDSHPAFASTAKISRGENYLGLPYVVLDYPRISAGDDLLFIRNMFWWGHFFSSTLQVAGRYREACSGKLATAYETLAANQYYIGVNEDPWQHHLEPNNYKKIAALTKEEYQALLPECTHIKIAAFWPLSEWDTAANHLTSSWRYLAGLVA